MAAKSVIIGEQPSTSRGHEEIVEEDKYAFMQSYEQQDITNGFKFVLKFWKSCELSKDQRVNQCHVKHQL